MAIRARWVREAEQAALRIEHSLIDEQSKTPLHDASQWNDQRRSHDLELRCEAALHEVAQRLRLHMAYASHSALMDPVLDAFERAIGEVRAAAPRLTFVSNLTGAPAGLEVVGRAAYWRQHLRQPVQFEKSVRALHASGITHWLEIGPHPVLVGVGAACVPAGEGTWLPSLRRDDDDWTVILDSLQVLHADGARIDWAGFDHGRPRRRVALPLYPFQRKRHWAEGLDDASAPAPDAGHLWRSVGAALQRQSDCSPIGLDLAGYDAKWASLARLTTAQVQATLRASGLFAQPGERHTAAMVASRLGAGEGYRHLLRRWLNAWSRPDCCGSTATPS